MWALEMKLCLFRRANFPCVHNSPIVSLQCTVNEPTLKGLSAKTTCPVPLSDYLCIHLSPGLLIRKDPFSFDKDTDLYHEYGPDSANENIFKNDLLLIFFIFSHEEH
jgi:hypothetical protein